MNETNGAKPCPLRISFPAGGPFSSTRSVHDQTTEEVFMLKQDTARAVIAEALKTGGDFAEIYTCIPTTLR